MKVNFRLNTGFSGCSHEEEMDFEEPITDEEIEEEFKDWAWEKMDGAWEKLDD